MKKQKISFVIFSNISILFKKNLIFEMKIINTNGFKIKKEDTTLLYHAVALFARLTDFFWMIFLGLGIKYISLCSFKL